MRDDMKLYNWLIDADWKYGDSVWIIPEDEDEGYLSVAGSNEVLGVIKNNVVILQPKEIIDNEDQLWIRRNCETYNDDFILINKKSGLYLSGKKGTTNPTIEG